jgi:hypothetical protein
MDSAPFKLEIQLVDDLKKVPEQWHKEASTRVVKNAFMKRLLQHQSPQL